MSMSRDSHRNRKQREREREKKDKQSFRSGMANSLRVDGSTFIPLFSDSRKIREWYSYSCTIIDIPPGPAPRLTSVVSCKSLTLRFTNVSDMWPQTTRYSKCHFKGWRTLLAFRKFFKNREHADSKTHMYTNFSFLGIVSRSILRPFFFSTQLIFVGEF